jgi:hypothetical protein
VKIADKAQYDEALAQQISARVGIPFITARISAAALLSASALLALASSTRCCSYLVSRGTIIPVSTARGGTTTGAPSKQRRLAFENFRHTFRQILP